MYKFLVPMMLLACNCYANVISVSEDGVYKVDKYGSCCKIKPKKEVEIPDPQFHSEKVDILRCK